MAQELIESTRLLSSAQCLLEEERGSFLLGHTAPDVQMVSGQPRHETHFYAIPPTSDVPAYRTFLAAHPALIRADRLDPSHAAFLAGYAAHLLADEKWWREIFYAFFGPDVQWRSWRERIFLHNVLRTYLDRQDQARLGGGVREALMEADPQGWLPFVDDELLRVWRDLLVDQLRPGERILTAEVFAARMSVPADLVETALDSSEEMASIFRHIPPARLGAYRADVLGRSIRLLNKYLGGQR
jgi:hypothetical protein